MVTADLLESSVGCCDFFKANSKEVWSVSIIRDNEQADIYTAISVKMEHETE